MSLILLLVLGLLLVIGIRLLVEGIRGQEDATKPQCRQCRAPLRDDLLANRASCSACGYGIAHGGGPRFGRTGPSVWRIIVGTVVTMLPILLFLAAFLSVSSAIRAVGGGPGGPGGPVTTTTMPPPPPGPIRGGPGMAPPGARPEPSVETLLGTTRMREELRASAPEADVWRSVRGRLDGPVGMPAVEVLDLLAFAAERKSLETGRTSPEDVADRLDLVVSLANRNLITAEQLQEITGQLGLRPRINASRSRSVAETGDVHLAYGPIAESVAPAVLARVHGMRWRDEAGTVAAPQLSGGGRDASGPLVVGGLAEPSIVCELPPVATSSDQLEVDLEWILIRPSEAGDEPLAPEDFDRHAAAADVRVRAWLVFRPLGPNESDWIGTPLTEETP